MGVLSTWKKFNRPLSGRLPVLATSIDPDGLPTGRTVEYAAAYREGYIPSIVNTAIARYQAARNAAWSVTAVATTRRTNP